jgi:hypothetical protein
VSQRNNLVWGFSGGAVGRRLALSVLESLWAVREGGAARQIPLKLLFLYLGGSSFLYGMHMHVSGRLGRGPCQNAQCVNRSSH